MDKEGYEGAVLTTLFQAFHTLNYHLFIVQLYAHGFSRDSEIDEVTSLSLTHTDTNTHTLKNETLETLWLLHINFI